jgi:hypothetical protein
VSGGCPLVGPHEPHHYGPRYGPGGQPRPWCPGVAEDGPALLPLGPAVEATDRREGPRRNGQDPAALRPPLCRVAGADVVCYGLTGSGSDGSRVSDSLTAWIDPYQPFEGSEPTGSPHPSTARGRR